jgi:hypothetical protein
MPTIELLCCFADCPNYRQAPTAVQAALAAAGVTTPINLAAVETRQERNTGAEHQQYYGSPPFAWIASISCHLTPLRACLLRLSYRSGDAQPAPPHEVLLAAVLPRLAGSLAELAQRSERAQQCLLRSVALITSIRTPLGTAHEHLTHTPKYLPCPDP